MKFWFKKKKPDVQEEFKDPDYPDGGPYMDESLTDYHDRKWNELDPDIRSEAVEYLRAEIAPECLVEWRQLMEADPEHWAAEHHFMAGMSFRNLLRKKIFDTRLPTENWDDYWVAAVEVAARFRPI